MTNDIPFSTPNPFHADFSDVDCEKLPPGSRLQRICQDSKSPASSLKPVRQTGRVSKSTKGKGCCGSQSDRTSRLNGGPGSQLMAQFESAGVPHCDECRALAKQMDRWGVAGCQDRLDTIVLEILPRAQTWISEKRPWIHALLRVSGAEDAALKVAIRRRVQYAIKQATKRASQRAAKLADKQSAKKQRSTKTRQPKQRFKLGRNWKQSFRPLNGTPAYVAVEDLARDAVSLVPRLPSDITLVIGPARSGLVPASLIASMLHVPMSVLRSRPPDVIEAGNGWRLLEGAPKQPGRTLVVDDTTMTGNSLLRAKTILANSGHDESAVFASIYCNPAAATKPDLWAQDLPWPHLLEWNLFNSVLLDSFALDFDGIICRDCRPEDDDDGPNYLKFLCNTPPLNLVRKRPIKLVVTARLEKYRSETLEWMDRWGVRAKELVMGPWKTAADRRRHDVAAWKAQTLRKFLSRRGGILPKFYIESNERQAKRIAELTGRLVVCPAAKRCFGDAKR